MRPVAKACSAGPVAQAGGVTVTGRHVRPRGGDAAFLGKDWPGHRAACPGSHGQSAAGLGSGRGPRTQGPGRYGTWPPQGAELPPPQGPVSSTAWPQSLCIRNGGRAPEPPPAPFRSGFPGLFKLMQFDRLWGSGCPRLSSEGSAGPGEPLSCWIAPLISPPRGYRPPSTSPLRRRQRRGC